MSRPSLDDPVVGALSEGVGGRSGARAGRHPWWTPIRVLLALATIVIAIGMGFVFGPAVGGLLSTGA